MTIHTIRRPSTASRTAWSHSGCRARWKCSMPPFDVSSRARSTWVDALDNCSLEELTLRENRRVSTALRMARLTTVKTLAGFDFAFQPSLDRNRILALAELNFIERAEVVHLLGRPAPGKVIWPPRSRSRR